MTRTEAERIADALYSTGEIGLALNREEAVTFLLLTTPRE